MVILAYFDPSCGIIIHVTGCRTRLLKLLLFTDGRGYTLLFSTLRINRFKQYVVHNYVNAVVVLDVPNLRHLWEIRKISVLPSHTDTTHRRHTALSVLIPKNLCVPSPGP